MAAPAPAVKRVVSPAPVAIDAPAFRRPILTRKRVALPLVGFAATFAFVSGSLINPLSGAYASTASGTDVATPAVATRIAGQNYQVTATGGPSASRDSYTVNYTPPVVKKATVKATTTSTSSATTTTTATAPVAGTPDPGSAQAIGAQMVAARGWGTDQYNCLVSLWNKESGWNVYASNPSGAYGIPQALPGSKMSSAGADWQTSAATQITWGLGYIQGHYGTPCAAWAHSEADNWY
ncbi:hypothetical protein C8E83_0798 [Frondihabitans australicus]|uniref:Transglycosylase-like protein with SLT domain n=1 Tax=Frondihabitans australicus TaxID=386892 RepID=A0A495ICH3_9MICO|nr:hypothetical protein C8E83_0798 [Frondihabitans australicus]